MSQARTKKKNKKQNVKKEPRPVIIKEYKVDALGSCAFIILFKLQKKFIRIVAGKTDKENMLKQTIISDLQIINLKFIRLFYIF